MRWRMGGDPLQQDRRRLRRASICAAHHRNILHAEVNQEMTHRNRARLSKLSLALIAALAAAPASRRARPPVSVATWSAPTASRSPAPR